MDKMDKDIFKRLRDTADAGRTLPVLEADGATFNLNSPANRAAYEVAHKSISYLVVEGVKRQAAEQGAEPPSDEEIDEIVRGAAILAMVAVAYNVPHVSSKLLAVMSDSYMELAKARDEILAEPMDAPGSSQFKEAEGVECHTADEFEGQVLEASLLALKTAVPKLVERLADNVGEDRNEDLVLTLMVDVPKGEAVSLGEGVRRIEQNMNVRSFITADAPNEVCQAVRKLLELTDPRRPENRGKATRVDGERGSVDRKPLSQGDVAAAGDQARGILDRLRRKGKEGGAS